MAELLYEAAGRQRIAVTAGADGLTLSSNSDLGCPYAAEPGERVEWVVEKGKRLYGSTPAAVEELEPRGERG